MNKNRLDNEDIISYLSLALIILITGIGILPSIHLDPAWFTLVAVIFGFMLWDWPDYNKTFFLTMALVLVHVVAAIAATIPNPGNTPTPEAIVQYASDNGYSEILIRDGSPPAFRESENDKFEIITKLVTFNSIIYQRKGEENEFRADHNLQPIDFGLEQRDRCEMASVDGKTIQTCIQGAHTSMILILDENGEVELLSNEQG